MTFKTCITPQKIPEILQRLIFRGQWVIIWAMSKNVKTIYSVLGICSFVFWANHWLFAKKWANEWFAQKSEQFAHLPIFGERPERFAHNRSFLVSDLSKSLMVAQFWWATWVICSQSLICLERSEQIAHSRSFDLSDLSKGAMSKWANSQPWRIACFFKWITHSLIFLQKNEQFAQKTESNFSNFVIKYLGKIETEFENTLAHFVSRAQMGSNHGKKQRSKILRHTPFK